MFDGGSLRVLSQYESVTQCQQLKPPLPVAGLATPVFFPSKQGGTVQSPDVPHLRQPQERRLVIVLWTCEFSVVVVMSVTELMIHVCV